MNRHSQHIEYNNLFKTMNIGICLSDSNNGTLLWVNRLCLQILHMDRLPNAPAECYLEDIVGIDTYNKIHNLLKEKHNARHIEFQFNISDDRFKWGEISCYGKGRHSECYIYNITDRKNMELKQKILQDRLINAQRMESIGVLTGGIAHEVNNCLTPIIIHSERIMNDYLDNENLYSRSSEIYRSAQSARTVIAKMMIFSKKHVIKIRMHNVIDIMKDIEKMLRHVLSDRIELIIDYSLDEQMFLQIDKNQMEQVIMNIANNAEQAIAHNGYFSIKAEYIDNRQADTPIVPDIESGRYILFTFSDNGCGIKQTIIDNVFEPFFTTKSDKQAAGLGLATVYAFVVKNKGFINIESIVNKGTILKMFIPAADNAEIPISINENDKNTNSAYNGKSIMIVDDNSMILDLCSAILNEYGYNTMSYKDPTEAINAIERDMLKPNLLITDIIMPEMNGNELYNKVKKIFPELNVLYMSGYSNNIFSSSEEMSENEYFISKPFSSDELINQINAILSK